MAGIGVGMSSERKQDSVDKCRENLRRLTATSLGMAGTASGSGTSAGTETDDRPGQRKRARDDDEVVEESSRSGKPGQVGDVVRPPLLRPALFGFVSVAGRLREMEDAVCVKPQFFRLPNGSYMHFFAVFDGHGGSYVCNNFKHNNFKHFSFFLNKKNTYFLSLIM